MSYSPQNLIMNSRIVKIDKVNFKIRLKKTKFNNNAIEWLQIRLDSFLMFIAYIDKNL